MLSSMPGCSRGVQPSDAQQVSLHCNHISKDCNITDAAKKTQDVHSGAIFADVGRNPTPHTLYETLGKKRCSDRSIRSLTAWSFTKFLKDQLKDHPTNQQMEKNLWGSYTIYLDVHLFVHKAMRNAAWWRHEVKPASLMKWAMVYL